MIEKVARALYALRTEQGAHVYPAWDDTKEWIKDIERRNARAAIAAMDEPTEAMRQAYFEASGDRFQDNGWERAISAALSQPLSKEEG